MAEHERLVHWVVRRQGLGPLPYVDAVHEGRIGLWRALRGYDPARGIRFSSYAVPAITRAVWAAVARERAGARPTPGRVGTGAPLHASDPAERLHATQIRQVLGALVAQLPAPSCQVVVAHLGLDGRPPQTFVVIGHGLGVTRQRAHQLYWDAVTALAHPAHSLPLRRLLERATRRDYQQTLARQHHRARARRRPRRPVR
jgi:RNA polymerase sigma factor (sigma-70 family)